MVKSSPADVVVSGAEMMAASVASVPTSTHTSVDIRLMLMEARRAASGLAAEARMASPYRVRDRNSPRASVASGITTSTARCSLRTRTPPTSHVFENGVGYAETDVGSGRIACANSMSCATPIVATMRITRGAVNRRRTTSSSIAPPTHRADDEARGEGQPVRHVPVEDHAGQQGGGEPAHLGRREVDDAIRPEHEDQRDRHHPVGDAGDGAGEGDLPGDVDGEEEAVHQQWHQEPRNTARARSSRAASSSAGPSKRIWPFSMKIARSADREGDVEGLLDDDHRQTRAP